jgi:hypothetical protein
MLTITPSSNYDSPRDWGYNATTMICFHGRYDLGDTHDYRADDYNGWAELKRAITKKCDPVVIYPLYGYDHGGFVLSTSPFSCSFDSGQVGYIIVSRASMNSLGYKRATAKVKDELMNIVENELDVYNAYLRGDVYDVTDENGDISYTHYGYPSDLSN